MKTNLITLFLFVIATAGLQTLASAGWTTTTTGPVFHTQTGKDMYDYHDNYYDWYGTPTAFAGPLGSNAYQCMASVVVSESASLDAPSPVWMRNNCAEASASFDSSIQETWSGPDPATCRRVTDDFVLSGSEYVSVICTINGSGNYSAAITHTKAHANTTCYLATEDRYLGTTLHLNRTYNDLLTSEWSWQNGTSDRVGTYNVDYEVNEDENDPAIYPGTTRTASYGFHTYNHAQTTVPSDGKLMWGAATYYCEGSYSTDTASSYLKNDHGDVNAAGTVVGQGRSGSNLVGTSCITVQATHINN